MPRTVSAAVGSIPPPSGAYSRVVSAGDFLYLSSVAPIDYADGRLVSPDITGQTAAVMGNIRLVLESVGAGLEDVVHCAVHLADPQHFEAFTAEYSRWFTAPYPARSTVGSDLGILPGMLIEIDVVAYRGLP